MHWKTSILCTKLYVHTMKKLFLRTGNGLHLFRTIACGRTSCEQNFKTSPECRSSLQLEQERFRQSGFYVPRLITEEQWTEIMHLKSSTQRLKYYKYLFEIELKNAKKAINRETGEKIKVEKIKKDQTQSADGGLVYGLGNNTLHSNIKADIINNLYNSWMCQSIMFGMKLVVDLSYSDEMTRRELHSCCYQILNMVGHNRKNREPFDFYFCNVHQNSEIRQLLIHKFPFLFNSEWSLMNVTEKSYLDLFPKEKLVYLTPHCDNDMTQLDSDTIYIIGGFVDKSDTQQISSVKAAKEGLHMARLPLNRYLDWGIGSKSLALDQMLKILLELKETKDWNKAFSHIPQRKLKHGRQKRYSKK